MVEIARNKGWRAQAAAAAALRAILPLSPPRYNKSIAHSHEGK